MELFKLFGTIALNNSDANKGIDDTTSKAEAAKAKLGAAFEKIGGFAVKAGQTIATGLAVGATAVAGLTAKAMSASGELEQNMGGSAAVFGEYAKDMQETAKKAFSEMGLSTSDYLATANKMGSLLKGAGYDQEAAMNISAAAMQRAADAASIMGIDTTAAMEAVAGAAKGNFTMMDNLGVAMSDANLQAYALEKGIKKSTQSMTNQEKIGLAMEMFLEKTADYAGNYAKENDTLAGSLGTAKAAMTNFLDGSGSVEEFVSSIGNLANVAVDSLSQIAPRLTVGLKDLIVQIVPMLPPLLEQLLPGLIEAATALMVGLISALPQILQILIEQLPFIITQISQALVTTFPILLDTIKSLFQQIWDYISLELLNTGVSFDDAFEKIKEVFVGAWGVMQDIWNTVGQPIFNMVQNIVGMVRDKFATMMPEIKEFVSSCFGDIKVFWENNLKPCLDAIGNFIETKLAPVFERIFQERILPTVDKVFATIKDLWNNTLKPVFVGITDFLTGIFTGDWEKAWDGIKGIVKGVVNGIISSVEFMVNRVIDAVNGIIGGINDLVGKVGDKVGLDVSIPEIRNLSLPRLEKGGVLERGQVGFLEGNGAEAVVPLHQNRKWISAVAEDMGVAIGSDNKEIKELKEIFRDFVSVLPEMMTDAFASMKWETNNREFARLVKAVN